MEKILEAIKITKNFGALSAVKDVEFYLKKGEILGLIGPNGAGKTTLLNIIAGIIHSSHGKVIFKKHDVTKKKLYEMSRLGIVKTAQIPSPFINLTISENIYIAAIFGGKASSKLARKITEELLDLFKLKDLKNNFASVLNINQRKKLEFARALATNPEILLLDETMSGLTPREIDEFLELIKEINNRGVAIIIVEHIIKAVKKICQRIMVLNYGRKIADGEPERVLNNPEVQKAYFGD